MSLFVRDVGAVSRRNSLSSKAELYPNELVNPRGRRWQDPGRISAENGRNPPPVAAPMTGRNSAATGGTDFGHFPLEFGQDPVGVDPLEFTGPIGL